MYDSPETALQHDRRALYALGGIVAFLALAGMTLDVALTMLPGWGPETVPVTPQAWLEQLAATPLLGMRNLDFLNVVVSLIALPMYVAACGAMRRTASATATFGLVAVGIGTALFTAANAALPLLELAQGYTAATIAQQAALISSAGALLATGEHGSFGAFPGFFVSEVGTFVVALAMLRGAAFGKVTGWMGIAGTAILTVYTAAYTFGPRSDSLVMAIAIPGGLLMMAWYARVGTRLLRLSAERGEAESDDGR